MGNGVYFGSTHSYKDLELILMPFSAAPAVPKTNFIDVPGLDGVLDFTEALGNLVYKAREFSFVFAISPLSTMTYDEKFTQVSNAINGRKFNITLDRDSNYYWEGRCEVVEYLKDKALKQITIKATVQPYKLKKEETVKAFTLSGDAITVTLTNSRKKVVPHITCTEPGVKVVFGNTSYALPEGTYKVLDIQLNEGKNTLLIEGTGTIEFRYREGDL